MNVADAQGIALQYGIDAARVEPADGGLINRTFIVTARDGSRSVLQWVNPLFGTEINTDIDALTSHLARHGVLTPHLLRTRTGALFVPDQRGHWRMMTHVDGVALHQVPSARLAREAGVVLGRFHRAALDYHEPFRHLRPGVHDTLRHIGHLRETLERRTSHPRHASVAVLGRAILADAQDVALPAGLPLRVVHGDPKISNVLFDRGLERALCLVDLDTVGRMAMPLELGDALRSWCNPAGEDSRDAGFSPDLCQAALRGYAEGAGDLLVTAEIDAIMPTARTICIELAARFCADALNEDYFAWDASRFPSHSEHSEVRAAGQLALARQMAAAAPSLTGFIRGVFAG